MSSDELSSTDTQNLQPAKAGVPWWAFTPSSRLHDTISELSLLNRSLLMAELAKIAYMSPDHATDAVHTIGFDDATFFDRDGAQAYMLHAKEDCVVAFRGTEPHEWNDIKADANAVTAVAETVGRVHSGFKKEVDDLWPRLETALVENTKALWFTGHSLGGAMAAICAGRCLLSSIRSEPKQLFTYGGPRVGDKRYVTHARIDWIRWVNNNDIVPRVPPRWMGYAHAGQEMYLNAHGKLRRMTKWQRVKDRWRGFLMSLRQGKIDHLADHSIDRYISYIRDAVKEHEGT